MSPQTVSPTSCSIGASGSKPASGRVRWAVLEEHGQVLVGHVDADRLAHRGGGVLHAQGADDHLLRQCRGCVAREALAAAGHVGRGVGGRLERSPLVTERPDELVERHFRVGPGDRADLEVVAAVELAGGMADLAVGVREGEHVVAAEIHRAHRALPGLGLVVDRRDQRLDARGQDVVGHVEQDARAAAQPDGDGPLRQYPRAGGGRLAGGTVDPRSSGGRRRGLGRGARIVATREGGGHGDRSRDHGGCREDDPRPGAPAVAAYPLLDGGAALRLLGRSGHDLVQGVAESLLVGHRSSWVRRAGEERSAVMAREAWLLTVPTLQPRTAAVSRSDRSSNHRSTTTAR